MLPVKEVPTSSDLFISPTRGKLTVDQVLQDIYSYLYQDPESSYRLVIGTDSHERYLEGQKITNFVTAVVVHRIGKGGRYFWKNGTKTKTHSVRDKVYQETNLSLDLAQSFVPKLNRLLNGASNWELEIHIDVGRSGETRSMIKEVVGMVVGSGYQAKTKPESFAASSVADRHS